MARYDSSSTEEPGQYPAPSFTGFGLPPQNMGTGAPGGTPPSHETDPGGTNEPGQYPSTEDFTGVALGGTGAPGTQGIPAGQGGGGDTVVYSEPTFYKGQQDVGPDNGPNSAGNLQSTATGSVSGEADWTQANAHSYGPGWNLPGIEGNTPTPGSGQYQTGAGSVHRGGYMNGQR